MKRLNKSNFYLAINPELAYITHLNKYADYLEAEMAKLSETHRANWGREQNETHKVRK